MQGILQQTVEKEYFEVNIYTHGGMQFWFATSVIFVLVSERVMHAWRSSGLSGRFEQAFSDVRIVNPRVSLNQMSQMAMIYRNYEAIKRNQNEQHVKETEMSIFVPLVFFFERLKEWACSINCLQTSGCPDLRKMGDALPVTDGMPQVQTGMFALLTCLRGSRKRVVGKVQGQNFPWLRAVSNKHRNGSETSSPTEIYH